MVRESYGKLPAPTKTSISFLNSRPELPTNNSNSRNFPTNRLIPRPTIVSYDRKSGEIKCINSLDGPTRNYRETPLPLSPNSDGPDDGPNPFSATKRFFSFRNQGSIMNTTSNSAVPVRKSATLNNNDSPSKNYQPQHGNGATFSKTTKNVAKSNFFSYIPNTPAPPGAVTASKKLSWSSIKKPLVLFSGQTTKPKPPTNGHPIPAKKSTPFCAGGLPLKNGANGGENDHQLSHNEGSSPLNRWRNPKLRYNAPKNFNLPPSPKSPQQLSYANILSQIHRSPEDLPSYNGLEEQQQQNECKIPKNVVPQTPDLRKRALLSDILLNLPPPPSQPPSPPELVEEEIFEQSNSSHAKEPKSPARCKIYSPGTYRKEDKVKANGIPTTSFRSKSDLVKNSNAQARRPNLIDFRLNAGSSIPLPLSLKSTSKSETESASYNFENLTSEARGKSDPDAHYHSVSLFDSGVSSCSPPSTLDACVDTKELEQLCNEVERVELSEKVQTIMPEVCDKVRSILHRKEVNGYSMTDIMELLERQNELLIKARHEKDDLIKNYENRIAELEETTRTSLNRRSTNFYFEHQTQKSKNNLNHHLYFLHTSLDTLFNQISKSFQKYMILESQNDQLTNVIKELECTNINYEEEIDYGKPQLFHQCDTFHNDLIAQYDFMS